jgi:methanogenic corrinoid protein MtbC1
MLGACLFFAVFAVTQSFCDELGADGYGADATRAVEVAKNPLS